jgi:dTDP-glucose 4,6-dehydratase
MKTILITGGAGFIGSNLVEYLWTHYPDYKVLVLDQLTYAGNLDSVPADIKSDRGRFEFWYGNIKNPAIVDEMVGKSDVVIHMAAESHVSRSIFDDAVCFETNVIGTQVVSSAVLKHAERVERYIYLSTSEVYGSALTNPMDEDHPLNPRSPYASSKAGADRLVYSYVTTYDIPAVIVRPFNQFGPRQHLEKAIPRFITGAITGDPIVVHGDGTSTRDWVFVRDTCEAIDRLIHCDLDKIRGEVINLGTGRETTVKQIVEMVLDIFGEFQSTIKYIADRPGQVKRHISSTEKAERLLGWSAGTGFEEGLRLTAKWYTENPDWWKNQLWMRYIPILTRDGTMEMY